MKPKKLTIGQSLLAISVCIVALVLMLNDLTLLGFLLVPYVLPTLCAAFYTKKKDWWLIGLINLFFGLTVIGWIVCFIWAAKPDREDVIAASPELQARESELRAMRDSAIRQALARAVQTQLPEDQEFLNARVAEYKANYGVLPHAVREVLEAKEQQRRQEEAAQKEAHELQERERRNHLREVAALEKNYWETGDVGLLARIKELREQTPGQALVKLL
jgi:hypothetical protein